MKRRHWITAIALLPLVAAAITGMVWTRALRPPPESDASTATPAGKKLLARTQAANERPLQTARRRAALAVTPEELRLAHGAEKVGDHEAGLAFAGGLGTTALKPAKLTAEAKAVGARKTKADAAVKADQETIAQLTGSNSGHPTGRRVSFVNRFAIEDHFFKFSTSGQWMGDELQLAMPADQDSYAVVEQSQQWVAKDAENSARKAEEEWRRRHHALPSALFLRGAAIHVRPTASGVELRVRYITRASKRHETGQRL
jgi:hypothetical protein